MQRHFGTSISVFVAILVLSPVVFAQRSDLNGVWNRGGGLRTLTDGSPPMTPAGQARFDANKPSYNLPSKPRAVAPAQGNDPAGNCDPLGLVRSLFAFRPVEFVVTPNRVFQFFEWNHMWRTIWTDGRKLPEDPDPKWFGYSVGRWEGDTLVVDSIGFDDRTWLDQYGHPFSESMRLEERWRRVNNTLELMVTVNDPQIYTRPWVSNKIVWTLRPNEEIREEICAPMDEQYFNERVRNPAGGKTTP